MSAPVAQQSLRRVAIALVIGAVTSLLVDAVLQNALTAARSPGVASMTPWWVVGRVMERSPWIVLAVLIWTMAPALSRALVSVGEFVIDRATAFDVVGRAMIVLPLLWLLATWVVVAAKITLEESWGSEGRVFVSGGFYYNVLLAYAPWALSGITLLALRRHVV